MGKKIMTEKEKLQLENGMLKVLLINFKKQIDDVLKVKKKNGKAKWYYGRKRD
jgi:hypothetical protein|tara:strand:- start:278 stop:436 length:159 start_codon:yes stop_codon:yes gene_type:complete